MTNLSDLLPAGAASKQLSFTADGAIASGQTVALQSNGTVIAVSSTAAGLGSEVVFESANAQEIGITYDTTNDKVVIVYKDAGNSDYGTAVVGTVSGKTISFGTPVVYESAATEYNSAAFDSTNGKVVVAYKDQGNSNYGTAVVGTVSGTSISFGTPVVFESGISNYVNVAYDSTNSKAVISYATSSKGKAIVGNVSGTSISFGSPATFNNANTIYAPITFDSNAGKIVIAFRDQGNSNYGTAVVGTVSSTSISFGSETVFESATSEYMGIGFDSTANKVIVGYSDDGNSAYATAVVGTVSGTSISFGTPVVAASSNSEYINVVHNAAANHMFYTFMSISNSNYGAYLIGTVSGTSISFTSIEFFNSARSDYQASVYDPDQEAVVIAYSDDGNSDYGTAIVYQDLTTNSSSFLGIADAAISNAASGNITMKGGVATNSQLLPQTFTPSVGSEALFQSSATYYTASVYDPDSGKTIIAWKGTSDYGYAVVATPASDNSITYGTPVAFNSAGSNYINIDYDTGQDKVLIVFTDASGSNKVRAIVGTVSGTSISFGSVLEVETNASDYCDVAYSPDSSNHLVVYRDGGNSNYGSAKVLTVSGTSVTAGSKVAFNTSTTFPYHVVYDTSNDKFVIAFRDTTNSSYGTAIVSSVSGTTPSFGTKVAFSSALIYENPLAYDSANGKVVIFYKPASPQSPTAIVGTVSGTSISFGSAVVVDALSSSDFYAITFDSTANKVIVAYRDEDANPDDGICQLGTVSGTSISFAGKQIFNDASTKSTSLSYNAGVDRTVIAYRDLGNSSYGTGIVLKLTSAYPNLVPNTTYYVQNDGTLSTTSSTVTAGKAMSTNSINLDYST